MDSGLIPCPYCDFEVIPGADHCDGCGQPLNDNHLPVPATHVERALLSDRLALLARRWPLVVSPALPVREAIRLMAYNNIGCLVVVEDGKLAGVFTERDVLLKINEHAPFLGEKPIADYMTRNVTALMPSAKIAFAVHQMDVGGYRHIPIADAEGRLIGIVSVRDILNYLTEKIRSGKPAAPARGA